MVVHASHALESIQASCNGLVEAIDILVSDRDESGLVAFASGSLVYLWELRTSKVIHALHWHTGRVNCVQCVTGLGSGGKKEMTLYLLTGDAHGHIALWSISPHEDKTNSVGCARVESNLLSHSVLDSSILSLAVCHYKDPSLGLNYAFVVGMGSIISVLSVSALHGGLQLQCSINLGDSLALCIACSSSLSNTPPLAFVGYSDGSLGILALMEVENGTSMVEEVLSVGKVHTDWIRSISLASIEISGIKGDEKSLPISNDSIFIATASQDTSVRLLSLRRESASSDLSEFSVSTFELIRDNVPEDTYGSCSRVVDRWSISLHAMLFGHEDRVFSVKWAPQTDYGGRTQPLALLSCSVDRALMIWTPRPSRVESGSEERNRAVWFPKVCLGEAGREEAKFLGFCGCHWALGGSVVIANTYNGVLHAWEARDGDWNALVTPTGHTAPVTDCRWSDDFGYFFTCSEDKTVRVYAHWQTKQAGMRSWLPVSERGMDLIPPSTWLEAGRPLVHGHEVRAIVTVSRDAHTVAIGAEEGAVRVLTGPRGFAHLLDLFFGVSTANAEDRPATASAPALGLSNQEVISAGGSIGFDSILTQRLDENAKCDSERLGGVVPNEDFLSQHTLWPEIGKAFGHRTELVALASSHERLASAGEEPDTEILLWRICVDSGKSPHLKRMLKLPVHRHEVSQMEFSEDGEWLLSVSEDGSFAIHSAHDGELLAHKFTHCGRLVACSWETGPQLRFAIAGNNGSVSFYQLKKGVEESNSEIIHLFTHEYTAEIGRETWITALAFILPNPLHNAFEYTDAEIERMSSVIAMGTTAGAIFLCDVADDSLSVLSTFAKENCHAGLVSRLRWRRHPEPAAGGYGYQLLTCGRDCGVRLFSVSVAVD